MSASRNVVDPRNIIDLTNDDVPNTKIVINILDSDSEDELFRPHQKEIPKQEKPTDKQRKPLDNNPSQKERIPTSSQRGTVPLKLRRDNPEATKVSQNSDKKQAGLVATSNNRAPAISHARSKRTIKDKEPDRRSGIVSKKNAISEGPAEPSVPSTASKDTGTQQIQNQFLMKPHRLHCTECIETGLECDGERPCSRCIEPGLDCKYSDSTHRPELPKTSESARVASNITKEKPRRKNPVDSIPVNQAPSRDSGSRNSDVPLMEIFESARAVNLPEGATQEQVNPDVQQQYPHCDWTPSTYEETRELITTMDHNLAAQREYWLQAALLQAVNRARQTKLNPSPTPKENPFKKFVRDKMQASKPQGEKKAITIYKGSTLSNKKTGFIYLTELGWDDKQPVLPQYKSIGRMGSNFVAKNIHTLKHLPYFPDDEAEEVRTERESWLRYTYRNNGHSNLDEVVKELVSQRLCLERVHRWSSVFFNLLKMLKLTPDIVIACFGKQDSKYCRTCRLNLVLPLRYKSSVTLSSADQKRCDFLERAFENTTNFSVLHFFEEKYTGKLKPKTLPMLEQRKADSKPSICMICCVPNCAVHGLYVDGGAAENREGPLINDPEIENNRREQLVLKKPTPLSDHICGLYCEGADTRTLPYSAFFGVDDAGTLTGVRNPNIDPVQNQLGFDGIKPCDRSCFIVQSEREGLANCKDGEARRYLEQKLSSQQIRYLEVHTKLFKDSMRLPCSLARRLKLKCLEMFKCLVMLHRSTISTSNHDPPVAINQGSRKAYTVRPDKWEDREVLKKSFFPCSHRGPCKKESGCPCAERDGHCEYSCRCDGSCYRRFPGCTCTGSCQSKCNCFLHGRECDPWVCKSCGVLEVLDPSNKYDEEIRQGRCRNNRTQLGLPARTVKGSSQIQGWGLFAGEDMPKSTYIGEYKGEIVTRGADHEGERRGLVYRQGGLEYLFDVNGEQELDGSRFGNKMRYINHTHVKEVINLESRRQLVNGVARVSFWTARNIKAGEEFFYNYGYDEEHTANFRTLDADLNVDPLLPIPKPAFTKTGVRRANQTAFQSDEESEESSGDVVPSPPPRAPEKQARRKRKANEGDEQMQDSSDVPQRAEPKRSTVVTTAVKTVVLKGPKSRQPSPFRRTGTKTASKGKVYKNASDDEDDDYIDDYAARDVPSTESASEVGSVDSDEVIASIDDKPKKKKGRPRLADKVDKRRGGLAQKKAQETRKKNRERMGLA